MDTIINGTIEKSSLKVDDFLLLRSMLYLVKPSETYYENAEEVPDLVVEVLKFFFGFILIEQIIFLLKDGKFNGRMSDAVSENYIFQLNIKKNREIDTILMVYFFIIKTLSISKFPI